MADILIVNSSYRKKSNTGILTKIVAEKAAKKHNVETVDISRDLIKPCMACGACLKENSNFCVIDDDMKKYYEKIAKAKILILSSPIYWFNICGQLKQFFDRCFALAVHKDENINFTNKKIGVVFAYEGADPYDSGCINAIRSFQDICMYTKATWLGAVYGSANIEGEMVDNKHALAKAEEFAINL